MKKKVENIVRFPGLKDRSDTFEFVLDDSFFAFHDQGEWNTGDVRAVVEMIRKPDMITLVFMLDGTVEVTCDRCLEHFAREISTRETLYLKYGDEPGELDENIVIINRDQTQLDVSHFLYEFITLALPVKKVHPDLEEGIPGCDPVMMERLERHSVQDEKKETDPRWEELKKLIDKN